MKRVKQLIRKWSGLLACLGLAASTLSANQACFLYFHQPIVPDGVKELKRSKIKV